MRYSNVITILTVYENVAHVMTLNSTYILDILTTDSKMTVAQW